MRLVLVEWVDSHNGSHWKDISDMKKEGAGKFLPCHSVGWLVVDTKEAITIVPHIYDEDALNDKIEIQGCGEMTIPQCAIQKITDIGELSHDNKPSSLGVKPKPAVITTITELLNVITKLFDHEPSPLVTVSASEATFHAFGVDKMNSFDRDNMKWITPHGEVDVVFDQGLEIFSVEITTKKPFYPDAGLVRRDWPKRSHGKEDLPDEDRDFDSAVGRLQFNKPAANVRQPLLMTFEYEDGLKAELSAQRYQFRSNGVVVTARPLTELDACRVRGVSAVNAATGPGCYMGYMVLAEDGTLEWYHDKLFHELFLEVQE